MWQFNKTYFEFANHLIFFFFFEKKGEKKHIMISNVLSCISNTVGMHNITSKSLNYSFSNVKFI